MAAVMAQPTPQRGYGYSMHMMSPTENDVRHHRGRDTDDPEFEMLPPNIRAAQDNSGERFATAVPDRFGNQTTQPQLATSPALGVRNARVADDSSRRSSVVQRLTSGTPRQRNFQYPSIRESGYDTPLSNSFALQGHRGAVAVNVPDSASTSIHGPPRTRPFWCLPHSFPLDYNDPDDREYASAGIRSLQKCVKQLTRSQQPSSDVLFPVRRALLLFHVQRFVNFLADNPPEQLIVPQGSDSYVMRPSVTGSSNDMNPNDGFDPSAHMNDHVQRLNRFRSEWQKLRVTSVQALDDQVGSIEKSVLQGTLTDFDSPNVSVGNDDCLPQFFSLRYLLKERLVLARCMLFAIVLIMLIIFAVVLRFSGYCNENTTLIIAVILAVASQIAPGIIIYRLTSIYHANVRLASNNETALRTFVQQVYASGGGTTVTDVLPNHRVSRVGPDADESAHIVGSPITLNHDGTPIVTASVRGGAAPSARPGYSESVRSDGLGTMDGNVALLPLGSKEMRQLVPKGGAGQGFIRIPWDDINRSLVVIGVRHSENPRDQRIVFWNDAAKRATGLNHFGRPLAETVEESSAKRLNDILLTHNQSDEFIELSFHNNMHGSVLLRLRARHMSMVSNAQRQELCQVLVLIGHDRVEDTAQLQAFMGYRSCINQILNSPLRRELAQETLEARARRWLYRPFLRFLDEALSWEVTSKIAKGMSRWQTFTPEDMRRELVLSTAGKLIVVVGQTFPPRLAFDRLTIAALQRVATLLHRSPRGHPVQAKFEVLHIPLFPAFRVIFTPTTPQDIDAVLDDIEVQNIEKDVGFTVELYRGGNGLSTGPTIPHSDSVENIPGDKGEKTHSTAELLGQEQLSIIIPFKRPESGDREIEPLPQPNKDGKDGVQFNLSVVLFLEDDFLRGTLHTTLAKTQRAVVQLAENVEAFRKRLNDADAERVHIAIIDKDHAEAKRIAFSSRWKQTIIVANPSSDHNRDSSLEPIQLTTAGGFGSWAAADAATNELAEGEPYELAANAPSLGPGSTATDGDAPPASAGHLAPRLIPRQYTLFLPVRSSPVFELLNAAASIEGDRREMENQNVQNQYKLNFMKVHFEEQKQSVLGEGRFGTVHVALVNGSERLAVKSISFGQDGMRRILSEDAALTALVGCRYVVKLKYKNSDEKQSVQRFFMEICDRPLDSVVGNWRQLPAVSTEEKVSEVVARVKAIARALEHLTKALRDIHARKFVHHDLKPDNIMAVSVDPAESNGFGWEIRVIDFTESAQIHQQLQDTRGTVGYVAPEMHDKCVSDPKCDIYSLGVVAMEVCGWAPQKWSMLPKGPAGEGLAASMDLQLRDVLDDHCRTFRPHQSPTVLALRRLLQQFITACLHPAPHFRPEAEGLLQYPLLEWSRKQTDNGGQSAGDPAALIRLDVRTPHQSPLASREKAMTPLPNATPPHSIALKDAGTPTPVSSAGGLSNAAAGTATKPPRQATSRQAVPVIPGVKQSIFAASAHSTPRGTPMRTVNTPDPEVSPLGSAPRPPTPHLHGTPSTAPAAPLGVALRRDGSDLSNTGHQAYSSNGDNGLEAEAEWTDNDEDKA
jgi:serine/threonine protein kinase